MKSDSCNEHTAKEKYFTTKLSLRKLMSVSQKLSTPQRKIVESLGFHHLLDLSCDHIAKSVVLYLVKHFDVSTRRLILPSGYNITLTSLQVHQILGIRVGGFSLFNPCDDSIKNLISEDIIKCSGKYPTINELMNLITDDLEGDRFKMIFKLLLVTCFLCPTSSETSTPDFCSLVSKPDQIASYDWSGIVLDKLVDGIKRFQQSQNKCGVSALSGCVFVLMIIYFEFLDVSDCCLPNSIPRIKLWTTAIVMKFTELDAINEDRVMFGRKPMKDISLTAFSTINLTEGLYIDTKLDVQGILRSLLPGEEFDKARKQLQNTYEDMWSNFVKVTRPALIDQIVKTAEIIKSNHCSSSFLFSRNFDSQCKLPRSTDICQSIDKVMHQSTIPNQQSEKSSQLEDFEFLRIPEVDISDTFAGYRDHFRLLANSLCEMELEEINDISELTAPALQDFVLPISVNESHQVEVFPNAEAISELTLSFLTFDQSPETHVVIEPKLNLLEIESSTAAQVCNVMPLKKRPIRTNFD